MKYCLAVLLWVVTVGVVPATPTIFNHHVSMRVNSLKYGSQIVFRFYKATQPGGPYKKQAQTTGSWVDTNVQAGVTYYYYATAYNTKTTDESAASNFIKARIP